MEDGEAKKDTIDGARVSEAEMKQIGSNEGGADELRRTGVHAGAWGES